MKTSTLLASKVAVGHCVIINDCDCPTGRLVAVVTDVTTELVSARYLSTRTNIKICSSSWPEDVTPVNHFGLRVHLSKCGTAFWCERDSSLPFIATYPDGKPRRWQEEYDPPQRISMRYKAKSAAIRIWQPRQSAIATPPVAEAACEEPETPKMTLLQACLFATGVFTVHDATEGYEAAAALHRELTRISPVVAAAKRWADGTGSFETTRELVEAINAAGEGKSDG